jgi:hypothetical protein
MGWSTRRGISISEAGATGCRLREFGRGLAITTRSIAGWITTCNIVIRRKCYNLGVFLGCIPSEYSGGIAFTGLVTQNQVGII